MDRRSILKASSGMMLGSMLPPMVSAGVGDGAGGENKYKLLPSFGSAKSVIYVYLGGGLSHVDSFDIKPEFKGNSSVAEPIKTSADGVRISHFFPKLAKQMHHIAVINSLKTSQGAHLEGGYIMHKSYIRRGTIEHPDLGAWASKHLGKINPALPAYVKINNTDSGSGYFDSIYGALPVGRAKSGIKYSKRPQHMDEQRFQRRLEYLKKVNGPFEDHYQHRMVKSYTDIHDDALKLMTGKDIEAFDISAESPKMLASYGDNSFSEGCLLARRLVEKGVRYVEVNSTGWDHHKSIYKDFATQASEVDQGLAMLISDLHDRGLLDSTLVVLATEFGRSPKMNVNDGRDHFPAAFSGLMAGGSIKGGQIYGKTNESGSAVIENVVQVPDFNATIAHQMGLDITKIEYSPTRRPFTAVHKGEPVLGLM